MVVIWLFFFPLFKYFHLNSKAVHWGRERKEKKIINNPHGISENNCTCTTCSLTWNMHVLNYQVFYFCTNISFCKQQLTQKIYSSAVLEKMRRAKRFLTKQLPQISARTQKIKGLSIQEILGFGKYLVQIHVVRSSVCLSFVQMTLQWHMGIIVGHWVSITAKGKYSAAKTSPSLAVVP